MTPPHTPKRYDTDYALLDSNESPFGPPPRATEYLLAHLDHAHRYPRQLRATVTAAVADHYGVDPGSILLTNGVDEAVDLLLSICHTAWYVHPGFDGYADRAKAVGRRARPISLDEDWQPSLPVSHLTTGDAVFLAQPHNPTGNFFNDEWVANTISSPSVTFLDETYLEFSNATTRLPDLATASGLLIFKSFSKAFGLAGLRAGVVIGRNDLISVLSSKLRFHTVDSLALSGLLGALEDHEYIARYAHYVRSARPRLLRILAGSTLVEETRDTQANFVLARCRSPQHANTLVMELAAHRVLVRDGQELGLPAWLRISVGSAADLARLQRALDDVESSLAEHSPDRRLASGALRTLHSGTTH